MALPLQPIVSLQPMPLLKRIPVEVIPVEHTARRVEGALIEGARLTVGWSMSLGRVRRPMTSSDPPLQTSHGNGMALPAPIDAATCASRIPIPCGVMGTKRRAHPQKDERRLTLILSPASLRGFFLAGRSAVWVKTARHLGLSFSVPLSDLCKSTCLDYLAEAPSFLAPVSYGASRDPARLRPPGGARAGFSFGD
jgi:hypothetical protein